MAEHQWFSWAHCYTPEIDLKPNFTQNLLNQVMISD